MIRKECKYTVKKDGRDRTLCVECRDCFYGMSLEGSEECFKRVLKILYREQGVDKIVLSDLLECEYDRKSTRFLREICNLLENTRVWPYDRMMLDDGGCKKCEPSRKREVERIIDDLLLRDPISTYFELLGLIKSGEDRMEAAEETGCVECEYNYITCCLKALKDVFESSESFYDITMAWKRGGRYREIYGRFLFSSIRPYFSRSRILPKPPHGCSLTSAYRVGDADIRIYASVDYPENFYFVCPPEYSLSPEEFQVINAARKRMLHHSPENLDFASPERARLYFKRVGKRIISELASRKERNLSREDITLLSEILAKYTAGLGILEVMLNDPHVQDVYINAPVGESPISLNHRVAGDCSTNVFLGEKDADALISRFRSRSGRAFSEAAPVLDLELPEFGTRVCTIGRPLSPNGAAFALRRQKSTPWTLAHFVDNGFLSPYAAGLLSFLIEGQASILVTGSRGSGKTSLLESLLLEIPPQLRILTIEDTLELPVAHLNELGYRIQQLKVQSAVGGSAVELSAAEALATALRLGESVLVMGEVRGSEAKVLYEAMRVGAAGNSVLGTIHGSSTESVFERVVYDIGIPPSSFKATDVVVTAAPVRPGGGIRRLRRVMQISEILKDWGEVPDGKEFYADLMAYDSKADRLEKMACLEDSEIVAGIARSWNMTCGQALDNVELRAKMKGFVVDFGRRYNVPAILEGRHTARGNLLYRTLLEKEIAGGKPDFQELYDSWEREFTKYARSAIALR